MDPLIGQIMTFAGTYAPIDWLLCDGSLQPISSYQALYAVIGTMYGGNGSSNFALPDLRGRMAIGMGAGPGLPTYAEGSTGGETTVALTTNTMPAHNHSGSFTGSATLNVASAPGSSQVPAGNLIPSAINTSTLDASAGSPQNVYTFGSASSQVAVPAVNMSGVHVGTSLTGSGTPHDNMSPYVAMTYCICYNGIFPVKP